MKSYPGDTNGKVLEGVVLLGAIGVTTEFGFGDPAEDTGVVWGAIVVVVIVVAGAVKV